jgi:hypothetical protein
MEPEVALFTLGLRLEAIGYMVFERLVELDAVDELMGGFALAFWSRAEVWVKKMRVDRRDPKVFEWCSGLPCGSWSDGRRRQVRLPICEKGGSDSGKVKRS